MNLHTVGGRPWDSFDAYLFDIDGTLLHCTDAVHYFAFCDALQTITGRALNLDGVNAHGNTDVGILRDALKLANVEDSAWRPKLPEIRASIARFVTQHEDELCANALPSAQQTLEHLRSKGAILGVATGNLGEIGTLKLKHAGLFDSFQIFGWSDAYEYRADVFRAALKLIRDTIAEASICVLGDTPSDVEAAHAVGVAVIAVATGVYSQEELLASRPDLCLGSLEELFR